jgi:hypothetical protein
MNGPCPDHRFSPRAALWSGSAFSEYRKHCVTGWAEEAYVYFILPCHMFFLKDATIGGI